MLFRSSPLITLLLLGVNSISCHSSSYIHYDLTQPNNNNDDDDDDDDNFLDYAQLRNQTQHLSEIKTNK